jgi:hypothetical protein
MLGEKETLGGGAESGCKMAAESETRSMSPAAIEGGGRAVGAQVQRCRGCRGWHEARGRTEGLGVQGEACRVYK